MTPSVDPATADIFKALAGETCQRVLQQLADGTARTVCEIAGRCAPKPSTASEHARLLRRGGLVISRKEGSQAHYRADGATMAQRIPALQAYLANYCPPDCAG